MQAPTVAIESYWRDKEQRDAQLTLHVPFSHDLPAVQATALAALSVVQGISNAVLVGYRLIWKATLDDLPEPPLESDVTSFLGLFYRSDDETTTEAIWIPSPRAVAFEHDGPFAGIRADASFIALSPLRDLSLLGPLLSPEGTPYPVAFLVGGLRL